MSNSPLQTLWSLGVVKAFGSALEPGAKVSCLLPGAPWPDLGAGGFRFAAAGGDVSFAPEPPAPPLPSQAAGLWKSNQAIHEWSALGRFVQEDAVALPSLARELNSKKAFCQALKLYFNAP